MMRSLGRWCALLGLLACWAAWGQTSAADEGLRIMADRARGNCIACHEIPVLRDTQSPAQRLTLQGTMGPSLQGVGARYSRVQLRQWIVDARVIRPDTLMPPYGTTQGLHEAARAQPLLNPDDIDAVVNALAQFIRVSSDSVKADAPRRPSMDSTAAQVQSSEEMNPVAFWVEQGQDIWRRDCVSCHTLADVVNQVPRFPKLHAKRQLINLEDQILLCRERSPLHNAASTKPSIEDTSTLSLSAFLHNSARHRPIESMPPAHAPEASLWQQHLAVGEQLFTTRMGHMNLSCRQCHDDNVGATMRSFLVTPAQPVGFPVYRLSWQGMGSMDRRIRACFSGVQAQVPAAQDLRLRQLELYLKHRARGLLLQGPSVKP